MNCLADAGVALRAPTSEDGLALSQLVDACPPLDTNSVYCNLLQCSHFAATSVVAERKAEVEGGLEDGLKGQLVGAITGYRLPEHPEVLFIWQVAVDASARGLGLAKAMLSHLLERTAGPAPDQSVGKSVGNCTDKRIDKAVAHLHTTITRDNRASWALFESLARDLDAELNHEPVFDQQRHFGGQHDSEILVRIGPFNRSFSAAFGSSDLQSAHSPAGNTGKALNPPHSSDATRGSQKNGEAA